MCITGTFLDEITHNIPSQNWGAGEWRQEFGFVRVGSGLLGSVGSVRSVR